MFTRINNWYYKEIGKIDNQVKDCGLQAKKHVAKSSIVAVIALRNYLDVGCRVNSAYQDVNQLHRGKGSKWKHLSLKVEHKP